MVMNETGEVNLLDILAGMLATISRNLALSFAMLLAGAGGGVAYYLSTSDEWESSILIQTSLLSAKESEFLFAQLEKVKILPGITEEQQKHIKYLTYKVLTEERGQSEQMVYLQVSARVTTKELFPILQNAILNVINNSLPVVNKRNERQEYYSKIIAKIDEELVGMEKVKSQVSGGIQATYLNPSQLYIQTVELFKERVNLDLRKQEISSIHLLKGFDSLSFDRRPSLIIVVAIGIVTGAMVLGLILFMKFFISYFQSYQRTH